MTDNPYSAPLSAIDHTRRGETAAPFFAVSLVKLAVMSVVTFGFYELFWFYRNWHAIKQRSRINASPFWRAFFCVIFCYSCFSQLREAGSQRGITPPLPAGALATGWILTSIAWRLPDPYGLISLVAVVFLLPVQAYVNRINAAEAPDHDRNASFTAWNWVGVVLGSILLVLSFVGMFMPE
jgi:hypothetical protein